MAIKHNGYTFNCDIYTSEPFMSCGKTFVAVKARTIRTAVDHARKLGWFVGRALPGGRLLVLCPGCKHIIT